MTPTPEDVKEILIIAAGLVDKYGEEMRPLLDRAEREWARVNAPTRESETDRIRKMLEEDSVLTIADERR